MNPRSNLGPDMAFPIQYSHNKCLSLKINLENTVEQTITTSKKDDIFCKPAITNSKIANKLESIASKYGGSQT